MARRARTRPPRQAPTPPRRLEDPGDIEPYLRDEAHFPGGRAPAVLLPATEGEVAWALLTAPAVLVSGARSSLTGGATPLGEWVVSMERFTRLTMMDAALVGVEAGVTLLTLQQALEPAKLWYPPMPTFTGAMVGGAIATNAAGAATFKYGSTRDWVDGLTVMLACGEVLDLRRGEAHADPGGHFELETAARGLVRVPVPSYRMPDVAKRSAGYHAAPGMDLVDLFIGSEGTLGVVLEAQLRVAPLDFTRVTVLATLDSDDAAFALVDELRRASKAPGGIDLAAIEMMDRRCLELLREDGADREQGLALTARDGSAVLVQAELRPPLDSDEALEQAAGFDDSNALTTPLVQLLRILDRHAGAERLQVALPGDEARAAQFFALREAVPVSVNRRVGQAQRAVHPAIQKVAADMVVPFERFPEMMRLYHEGFGRRGLDHAIWGHISDGNVHPNVIPRTLADVELGKQAILEFGRELARLGGCPLSEHGVGRNPVKQQLLRQLYGEAGIEQMRDVKRALDPEGKLAPGVIFARDPAG